MPAKPFTFEEQVHLALLAGRITDEIDRQAGELLQAFATDPEATWPALHDRLLEIGRDKLAAEIARQYGRHGEGC